VEPSTLVTVLLPVYNAGKYLASAIESIVNQTYPNFELLIIDDGSTDDSAAVASSFSDPRIRYHKIAHGGLGNAINKGIELARYEIIVRMDADDIALPERLEKQIARYLTLPPRTILSCWYALFAGDSIIGIVRAPTKDEEIKKRLALHNVIVHSGAVFHRSTITELGGFWHQPFEDFEFFIRVKDSVQFHIIPETLMLVRMNYASLSRENLETKYAMVLSMLKEYAPKSVDIMRVFNIASRKDADIIRGWREYFYGSRSTAQAIWRRYIHLFNAPARVYLAYIICFLPEKLFIKFKESRMRFRLEYQLLRGREESAKLQNLLDHYIEREAR
jgi:glycosyltransferase involved in cell wall biosynthesis